MKFKLLVLGSLLLLLTMTGCTLAGVELSLCDGWNSVETDEYGELTYIAIHADDSGLLTDRSSRWLIKADDDYAASANFIVLESDMSKNTLTIEFETGERINFTYELSGDNLTLNPEGMESIFFERYKLF